MRTPVEGTAAGELVAAEEVAIIQRPGFRPLKYPNARLAIGEFVTF
jgi:hypothetical protein